MGHVSYLNEMSHKNFRANSYNRDENFYGEFHLTKKTIKNIQMKSINI